MIVALFAWLVPRMRCDGCGGVVRGRGHWDGDRPRRVLCDRCYRVVLRELHR